MNKIKYIIYHICDSILDSNKVASICYVMLSYDVTV